MSVYKILYLHDAGSHTVPHFEVASSCFSLRADKGGGHPGGYHRLQQRAGGLAGCGRRHPHGQYSGCLAQNPRGLNVCCQCHRWDKMMKGRLGVFVFLFLWKAINSEEREEKRKEKNDLVFWFWLIDAWLPDKTNKNLMWFNEAVNHLPKISHRTATKQHSRIHHNNNTHTDSLQIQRLVE